MRDRTDKLKLYDEILARQGVLFVDTASYLAAVRDDFAISLFPRGGTHWNMLGAAIGTEEGDSQGSMRSDVSRCWRLSASPLCEFHTGRTGHGSRSARPDESAIPECALCGAGIDLLLDPPADQLPPAPQLRTEVGGSFLFILNSTLAKLDCPPVITFWVYWNFLPVDAQARRRSLLDAQAIIFEENDSVAPGSQHGELMMQEVAVLKSTTAVC